MAGPPHRSVSNIRPPPSPIGAPSSPHTPTRVISSNYGSPSALRAEEEYVVLEVGSRYLRAGFAGDALPIAIVPYDPKGQRRAGDYRQFYADYQLDWRKRSSSVNWGGHHVLWELDVRKANMGLAEDKIERALREAYTRYLLIDSRPRKMILVTPTGFPLPFLSAVFDTLFKTFHSPAVSLLSAPMLTTAAAGLRTALVVDIGWAETTVTAIYEYRETLCRRSTRAVRGISYELLKILAMALDSSLPEKLDTSESSPETQTEMDRLLRDLISFEEVEDVLERVVWCRSKEEVSIVQHEIGLAAVREEEGELEDQLGDLSLDRDSDTVWIPLSSTRPPTTVKIPFQTLSDPCESALLGSNVTGAVFDDEELPLSQLVYKSLLQLPLDVRSACMSRITFTGGGSDIPGLKKRILEDVQSLIEQKGWDPVKGKAVQQLRENRKLRSYRPTETPEDSARNEGIDGEASTQKDKPSAASQEPQTSDSIDLQLQRDARKTAVRNVHGVVRAVDSMGAWTGASLLTQLKVPALSTVDRDQWLQYGLEGAARAGESVVVNRRQSMVPGGLKAGGDKSTWTLGPWA